MPLDADASLALALVAVVAVTVAVGRGGRCGVAASKAWLTARRVTIEAEVYSRSEHPKLSSKRRNDSSLDAAAPLTPAALCGPPSRGNADWQVAAVRSVRHTGRRDQMPSSSSVAPSVWDSKSAGWEGRGIPQSARREGRGGSCTLVVWRVRLSMGARSCRVPAWIPSVPRWRDGRRGCACRSSGGAHGITSRRSNIEARGTLATRESSTGLVSRGKRGEEVRRLAAI